MTNTRSREIPFLFAVAALDVLAVGYHFLRAFPVTTVTACSVLLVALAAWYARVRDADRERARRTSRTLVLAMIAFVLVVPFLLRRLLAAF
jgi:uncharacterized membrane protein YidH (DUF202 family)